MEVPAAAFVVFFACVVASSPATPAAVSPHDVALDRAARAFDALALEDAARQLEALIADPSTPTPTRARALLLLGLTRAGLVDEGGAADAFARALQLDPGLELPPDTSPKVQALFARTRAATPAPSPAAARPTPTTPPTPAAPTPPAQAATTTTATPDDTVMWTAGVGGALLASAVAAGVGAAVADDALGRPVAGRTRAEHDQIKALGLSSLVGSAVLGVAGVVGLSAAAAWSLDEAAP